MSKKEDDLYQEWLDEVNSNLKTPEQKAAFNALTSDQELGRKLLRGGMRESTFYTKLNELDAEKKQLEAERKEMGDWKTEKDRVSTWWQNTEPQVKYLNNEYLKLQKERDNLLAKTAAAESRLKEFGLIEEVTVEQPKSQNEPASDIRAEIDSLKKHLGSVAQAMQTVDTTLPKLLGEFGKMTTRITAEGWKVSPDQVLNHSLANGIPLDDAFKALTKDEREGREKAEREKFGQDMYEKGRREAQSRGFSPERMGPSGPTGPSIVEQLRGKNAPTRQDRINAAKQDWLGLPEDQRGGMLPFNADHIA